MRRKSCCAFARCASSFFIALLAVALSTDALAQGKASSKDTEPKKLEVSVLLGYDIEKSAPAHAKIKKAIRMFQKGPLPETRKLLDEARQEDPGLPPTDVTIAKLFAMARQGGNARVMLERAVDQEPGDPEPYILFGEIGIQAGHVVEGQLFFEKATSTLRSYKQNKVRKEKLALRLLLGYASLAERRGKWSDAVKYLKRWMKSDPENASGYRRLGQAYFLKGDQQRAYEIMKKASQFNADLIDASLAMANLYQRQGKEDRAELFISEASRITNANLQTRLGVAIWLATSDPSNIAESYMEEALEAYPESTDLHLLSGIFARNRKDYDEAEQRFEESHRLAPKNFGAANQLALIWTADTDEKKREKGIELAEKNLADFPGSSDARISLGWIYYRLGRTEEAQKTINPALKGGRYGPDSSYFVAQIFFDQGQAEKAMAILEQGLKTKQLAVFRSEAEALMKQVASKASIEKIRRSIQKK